MARFWFARSDDFAFTSWQDALQALFFLNSGHNDPVPPNGQVSPVPVLPESPGPSSGAAPESAADPVPLEAQTIWVLPLDDQKQTLLSPLGSPSDNNAIAMGHFVTSDGTHVEFMSSQPDLGLGGGLFIDTDNRSILGGSPELELHTPSDDALLLGGDVGMSLGSFGTMFDRIVMLGGSDYSLTTDDANVAAGHTLSVSAGALHATDHFVFDGSAETDGRFSILGGAGGDSITGGHGADFIEGDGGADILTGGGGADRFFYASAADSTGAAHDRITDFTFGEDVIDLPATVQGLDSAVTKGSLSTGSFDADLTAALGAKVLESGHALFFTPDSGELAGHTFLVVDGNGQAGYQAGADFVIELPAPPPADYHGTGFLV